MLFFKLVSNIKMSKASIHCVFCLKPVVSSSSSSSYSSSSVARCLELLERAVQLESSSCRSRKEDFDDFISVCGTCRPTLHSFSKLFGQLKEVELKLGWELSKLSAAMEHANHVPVRGSFVKGCYDEGEKEGKGLMEEMYTWRRSVSKRCGSKLSTSFPKVCILKLTSRTRRATIREKQLTVTRETVHSSQSDVEDGTGGGGGGGEEEANNNLSQMEHSNSCSSIDIKYEITSPPEPVEPDQQQLSFFIGSVVESSPSSASSSAGLDESAAAVRCSQCPAYFVSNKILSIHVTRAHRQTTRVKSEDARTGTKKAAAATGGGGSGSGAGGFQFQCSKCPKSFFQRKDLRGHFKRNHITLTGIDGEAAADTFKECQVSGCSATFRTASQLHRHRLEFHAGQLVIKATVTGKPCICVECGKAFRSRYKRAVHKLSEHPHLQRQQRPNALSPHECPKCGKVLSSRANLRVHLLRHQGPESFKYPCPTCGKRFVTKFKRDRHLPVHNKKKKHGRTF